VDKDFGNPIVRPNFTARVAIDPTNELLTAEKMKFAFFRSPVVFRQSL
jgi:hypothetical protein